MFSAPTLFLPLPSPEGRLPESTPCVRFFSRSWPARSDIEISCPRGPSANRCMFSRVPFRSCNAQNTPCVFARTPYFLLSPGFLLVFSVGEAKTEFERLPSCVRHFPSPFGLVVSRFVSVETNSVCVMNFSKVMQRLSPTP